MWHALTFSGQISILDSIYLYLNWVQELKNALIVLMEWECSWKKAFGEGWEGGAAALAGSVHSTATQLCCNTSPFIVKSLLAFIAAEITSKTGAACSDVYSKPKTVGPRGPVHLTIGYLCYSYTMAMLLETQVSTVRFHLPVLLGLPAAASSSAVFPKRGSWLDNSTMFLYWPIDKMPGSRWLGSQLREVHAG